MSATALALGHKRENQVAEILQASINRMSSNAQSATAEAREYKTVQQWSRHLQTRISGAALGTSVIPGLHGAGIVLELPYLFRLMGRGAIGTGELVGAK